MSSQFTVIYNAYELPAPLRDVLMRLALAELYRARWTDMIHDEWIRNVLKQRPDLKPEDLNYTCSLMNAHVRDYLVTNFEHLIPSVELPDNDDRHLVAQHPDDFIFDLLDLHPADVCEAADNHQRSLKNPPKTVDKYLDTLLKQGLTQTVGLLREWKVLL
nr:PIN domain-containing protein [Nitrosomonas nitrosa]